jgi:hypothetical protein
VTKRQQVLNLEADLRSKDAAGADVEALGLMRLTQQQMWALERIIESVWMDGYNDGCGAGYSNGIAAGGGE